MNISMDELTNSELVELSTTLASFELYMNRSLQTNFDTQKVADNVRSLGLIQ